MTFLRHEMEKNRVKKQADLRDVKMDFGKLCKELPCSYSIDMGDQGFARLMKVRLAFCNLIRISATVGPLT